MEGDVIVLRKYEEITNVNFTEILFITFFENLTLPLANLQNVIVPHSS
jgi:hypothetical protein